MSLNRIAFVGFLNLIISMACAQEVESVKKEPYYIDVNKADNKTIFEVQQDGLCLQYHDAYGKQSDIAMAIYDWKSSLVSKLTLSKTFGLNYFRLENISKSLTVSDNYTCKMTDEGGKKYEVHFKIVSPPAKPNPVVDIFVNPMQLNCKGIEGSLVEFYGQISGGKGPYKTEWFVLNNTMTDFLYQPIAQEVNQAGKSTAIEVDKTPDYYVLFRVSDACGGFQQKMAHIVCQDNLNKINTVFIEPIDVLNKNNRQPSEIK